MNEKRKYQRFKKEIHVRIDESDITFRKKDYKVARSVDLSAKGILVKHSRAFPMGTIVRVSFIKPKDHEIFNNFAKIVRAESVGKGEYLLALAFFNLTHDNEKELDSCLD
ncbi:MAG: PilZ domain-containing protein [Spirochaetales bacterium]|nr:PilZ domain-containing protein [Spirochaetales bacterium]